MKKALIYGLSAAMLLASLTACNTQADEPDPTPSATQTQPVETPDPQETAPQVEPLSASQHEPTQNDLEQIFRSAYDWGCIFRDGDIGMTEEEILQCELDDISGSFILRVDLKKPADLEAQYMTWREIKRSQEPKPTPPPETPEITEAPQQTVTQPQPQPATQITNNGTQTPPSSNTGGGTTQQQTPQTSGNSIFYNPFEGMTEEEKAAQAEINKDNAQHNIDQTTSTLH